ncbi:MAG: hypothetical protein ACT4PW_05540 [Acidimicrobiia bacterium]
MDTDPSMSNSPASSQRPTASVSAAVNPVEQGETFRQGIEVAGYCEPIEGVGQLRANMT